MKRSEIIYHLTSTADVMKNSPDDMVFPACGASARKGDRFITDDTREVTCKRCLKRMDKGEMIFHN